MARRLLLCVGGIHLWSEKKQQIVALALETVSNSAKVERFINELSTIYDRSVESQAQELSTDAERKQMLDLTGAEYHFEKAADAFMRLWRSDDARSSAIRDAGEFVLLDSSATVVSVQVQDGREPLFVAGESVFSTPTDADTEYVLSESLKQIARTDSEAVFSILPFYASDGQRSLWALSSARSHESNAVARLIRIDFEWSQAAGAAMAEAFSLSDSEQAVLKTLVRGQSLSDLAHSRQRSIQTVRTQAKSLLAKTGVGSQLDLIRLFAAITLSKPEVAAPASNQPDNPTPAGSISLTLPDNRQIQVDIHGHPTGRPVVFLHNMFSGTVMSPRVVEALKQYRIKLICPWRPGFAMSSPYPSKPFSLEKAFVSDLEFVLDAFGVEKTIAVGHMSAAVYAAATAALLPDRVHSALAIAGFPPFLNREHIHRLPAWPRLYAYTARYFPKALSLLVRGTFGLLIENRSEVLFDNLYASAPVDRNAISSASVRTLFLNDFRRAFQQGTNSYEYDAALAASDWSTWLKKLAPGTMTFVHGTQDPVTPFDLVAEIATMRAGLEILPIDNAGQLVLHQAPDQVASLIADLVG